jgi:hypothetical protein
MKKSEITGVLYLVHVVLNKDGLNVSDKELSIVSAEDSKRIVLEKREDTINRVNFLSGDLEVIKALGDNSISNLDSEIIYYVVTKDKGNVKPLKKILKKSILTKFIAIGECYKSLYSHLLKTR